MPTGAGFDIIEYRDDGVSGAKDRRPALDRLMRDARARTFDVVIVARFDRFARSVSHLLRALEEFNHLGIDFISLAESVDTATPMGKMIFTVLAAVAELERNLIRERIALGLARARRQGKRFGRSPRIFDRERARSLAQSGLSTRAIAKELGVRPYVNRRDDPPTILTRHPIWGPSPGPPLPSLLPGNPPRPRLGKCLIRGFCRNGDAWTWL